MNTQGVGPIQGIGVILMVFGATLLIGGALLYFGGHFGFLGKLPGDIRIERGNFRFYFPIATSILISLVLSLLLYLLSRLR